VDDTVEAIMGMIRKPWTKAYGHIWPGCWGYIPSLFWIERHRIFLWTQRVLGL